MRHGERKSLRALWKIRGASDFLLAEESYIDILLGPFMIGSI